MDSEEMVSMIFFDSCRFSYLWAIGKRKKAN